MMGNGAAGPEEWRFAGYQRGATAMAVDVGSIASTPTGPEYWSLVVFKTPIEGVGRYMLLNNRMDCERRVEITIRAVVYDDSRQVVADDEPGSEDRIIPGSNGARRLEMVCQNRHRDGHVWSHVNEFVDFAKNAFVGEDL
jgi:hypothetical protein